MVLEEYRGHLENFRRTRDLRVLVDALSMIPDVIRKEVRAELKSRMEKLEGSLAEIREDLEKVRVSQERLHEEVSDLNRRISKMELSLGGLAEATLAQFFIRELELQGYRIIGKKRNLRVDDDDVDLLVVAERDRAREHFLVEVKIKPRHSDVGSLLAKAELYEARRGVRPRPVLAGVWVGRDVEDYARRKSVLVYRL